MIVAPSYINICELGGAGFMCCKPMLFIIPKIVGGNTFIDVVGDCHSKNFANNGG